MIDVISDPAPAVLVTIDGVELPPEYASAMMAVSVDMTINLPRMAVLTFRGNDYNNPDSLGLDFEVFSLGSVLEVSMGIGTLTPVFLGMIASVAPDYGLQTSEIVVTGYDAAYKLQFGTHARSFEELPYSEIVEAVVGESAVGIEADPTEAVHDYVAQNNVSTYAFVMDIADRIGFELISDGDLVKFRSPRLEDPSVASVEYGVDLHEFQVRARALSQGSTVSRVAWDPTIKEALTGEAMTAPVGATMGGEMDGFTMSEEVEPSSNTRPTASVADLSGLEELATGRRTDILQSFIEGHARCAGTGVITAGSVVEVNGIGGRFNGRYYVTTAKHVATPGTGYVVDMDVIRTGA